MVCHRQYNVSETTASSSLVTVAHYALIEEIARGSTGIVFRALDARSAQYVAIKRITTTKHTTSAETERELALLIQLRSHPYIVQLLDHFNDGSRYTYLVFNLCKQPVMVIRPGESQEPLPEKSTLKYFRQVLLALEFLHANKVVHRDVKPENILLTMTGQVQLADLGVASVIGQDPSVRGTRPFMAPEMFKGEPYGAAEDVWSLGVTLFCFVTGRLPFYGDTPLSQMQAILTGTPTYPETMSVMQRALLVSMLRRDPTTRPTITQAKDHDWCTMAGGVLLPSSLDNLNTLHLDATYGPRRYSEINMSAIAAAHQPPRRVFQMHANRQYHGKSLSAGSVKQRHEEAPEEKSPPKHL